MFDCKQRASLGGVPAVLAQKERFELSRGDYPPTPLAGEVFAPPIRWIAYTEV